MYWLEFFFCGFFFGLFFNSIYLFFSSDNLGVVFLGNSRTDYFLHTEPLNPDYCKLFTQKNKSGIGI